jgi:hypothetical protein
MGYEMECSYNVTVVFSVHKILYFVLLVSLCSKVFRWHCCTISVQREKL